MRKAIALQPTLSHAYAYLTTIDLLRNDPSPRGAMPISSPPVFWHDYADTLARQREGDRVMADAASNGLIERYSYGGPFQIAVVYALRKEPDRVFEWLERRGRSRLGHDAAVRHAVPGRLSQ